MRVYLPATVADLPLPTAGLSRVGSAVTPALRAALPEEDEDGLEMSAFLTAADLSVLRIAETGAAPRRLVLSVEIDDDAVAPLPADLPETLAGLPSLLGTVRVRPQDLVALHLDAGSASDLVRAAVAGDDDAFDTLAEEDLLWYDPIELSQVLAALTTQP